MVDIAGVFGGLFGRAEEEVTNVTRAIANVPNVLPKLGPSMLTMPALPYGPGDLQKSLDAASHQLDALKAAGGNASSAIGGLFGEAGTRLTSGAQFIAGLRPPGLPPLPALPRLPALPPLHLPTPPELPRVPVLPRLPALPRLPPFPRIPPFPGFPGVPALPPLPRLPRVPTIPLPPLPTLPSVPGAPGIPSIPVPSLDLSGVQSAFSGLFGGLGTELGMLAGNVNDVARGVGAVPVNALNSTNKAVSTVGFLASPLGVGLLLGGAGLLLYLLASSPAVVAAAPAIGSAALV